MWACPERTCSKRGQVKLGWVPSSIWRAGVVWQVSAEKALERQQGKVDSRYWLVSTDGLSSCRHGVVPMPRRSWLQYSLSNGPYECYTWKIIAEWICPSLSEALLRKDKAYHKFQSQNGKVHRFPEAGKIAKWRISRPWQASWWLSAQELKLSKFCTDRGAPHRIDVKN